MKGKSPDELRVRLLQALAVRREVRGGPAILDPRPLTSIVASASRCASSDAYLEAFRAQRNVRFFGGFRDYHSTRQTLRAQFAEDASGVIAQAQGVQSGVFRLLGFEALSFGDPIDWQLEPTTRRRAPGDHWSRLDYLNPAVAGDKKVTWELNRHQHFVLLGRAYWHTGDESFADCWASHLAGWLASNGSKAGINWTSSLEVAFRTMSWIWALHFFRDSPALTPDLFESVVRAVDLNCSHLETYLSTYFSPNTHLTGEALGLFYAGLLLPELANAARWRETGRRILVEQAPIQIRPDGVYFEQTTYYHRYTVDFYLHFCLLARANGIDVSAAVYSRLELALEHLMWLTGSDGVFPRLGDDDGGRLMPLDSARFDDARPPLAAGALLFGRSDFKHAAQRPGEELLWLFGPEAAERWNDIPSVPPSTRARAFTEGGYFIARSGWDADDTHLIMDCGPHGALSCGHGHADALSFTLAINGYPALVDPGTFTYTGDSELRNQFRSTSAHNTVTVDGLSSSEPGTAFTWSTRAACTLRTWREGSRITLMDGEHNGYLRLPDPVLHRRQIVDVGGEYWLIRDTLSAAGEHTYDLNFHLAAGCDPGPVDSGWAVSRRGELFTNIVTAGPGRAEPEQAWVSPAYGSRSPATVLRRTARLRGPLEWATVISQGAAGLRVPVIAAPGRIQVPAGDYVDTFLCNDEAAGAAREQFGFLWLRRRGEAPVELEAFDVSAVVVLPGVRIEAKPPASSIHVIWTGSRLDLAGDFTSVHIEAVGVSSYLWKGQEYRVQHPGQITIQDGAPQPAAWPAE